MFPAYADSPRHALSLFGDPKYKPGFPHFDYVNPNAPKGGTVKFGSYGSFDNLNRVAFKGSKAAGLGYVNDTLMRRVWDEAFSLYGLIAEKVELPEDRSSITFYLNSNATFHDGSPITRDDVLFSLETFQTKGTPNQKKTYGKVIKTELIGNDGIKMIFENNEDKEEFILSNLDADNIEKEDHSDNLETEIESKTVSVNFEDDSEKQVEEELLIKEEPSVRRLSLFDNISTNKSDDSEKSLNLEVKTEPVILENNLVEEKVENFNKDQSNENIEPEFSASTDELDEEFNQETEEELLDIPTFLRRQAN